MTGTGFAILVAAWLLPAGCGKPAERASSERGSPAAGSPPAAENASPAAETTPPAGGASAPHTDHEARHGGLFGMTGDHHLELVVDPAGRMEVYVYDAHTQPVSVSGVSGIVTLELPAEMAGRNKVLLRPLPDGSALEGQSPMAGRATAATIDVTVGGEKLNMTFPLTPSATKH